LLFTSTMIVSDNFCRPIPALVHEHCQRHVRPR
jgi:hypothetical protein